MKSATNIARDSQQQVLLRIRTVFPINGGRHAPALQPLTGTNIWNFSEAAKHFLVKDEFFRNNLRRPPPPLGRRTSRLTRLDNKKPGPVVKAPARYDESADSANNFVQTARGDATVCP